MAMVIFNIIKLLLGYGPLPGFDESYDKVGQQEFNYHLSSWNIYTRYNLKNN